MNIINVDLRRTYTELLVIINNMSIENIEKIPKEILEYFENNKDDNYEFDLDYSKDLKEQELSGFTMAILNNLYRDYWASQDIKRDILIEESERRLEEERIKREKYNSYDIFKKSNKKNNKTEKTESNNSTVLVEYKEFFFEKLKNFIFRIFHINK